MMKSVLVVLAAAVVMAWVAQTYFRRRHWQHHHGRHYRADMDTYDVGDMETYAQETKVYRREAVDRTYKMNVVPRPPIQNGPLAPYLESAVDTSLPTVAPGESMMYSRDEVKGVLDRVVGRINKLHPGLELIVVSFDNVQKMVDAYKTTRYEADVQVHSVARMFSSRITVKAEVSASGTLFVRAMGVHNSRPDASNVAAASTFGETYAEFQPALSFPLVLK